MSHTHRHLSLVSPFPSDVPDAPATSDNPESSGDESAAWDAVGESLRDLVLSMRPSEWRYAIKLSVLDPCDVLLGLLVRAIAACRSALRPAVLLRCRVGDLSPIEAAVALRRERDARGPRASVTVVALPAR